MQMGAAVRLGLVVLLALAGIAPVAGFQSTETAAAQPEVQATYAVSDDSSPGVVTVETTYEIPETVVNLTVDTTAESITVTDATGFDATPDGWEWRRTDAETEPPSLTWRYEVNQTASLSEGYDTVDTGQWALVDLQTPALHYFYTDKRPTTERTVTLDEDTTGYVAGDVVYLGEYERRTVQRGDQTYTLVVASHVASPPDAETVFDRLAFANQRLRVGAADSAVVVFVATGPLGGRGTSFRNVGGFDGAPAAVWVHGDLAATDSAYYSEYVHTRQSFRPSERMSWFVEAQDGYYSELLGLYDGTSTYGQFRAAVATEEDASAVLAPADRTTYRRAADYTKGARVLAALDGKIRRATDRAASLEDVWRELNAHEGTVTYTDFTGIVADVAGESFDDWLTRHLTTTAAPTVPDNRTLYAPVDAGVGDGTDTKAELANGTTLFATPEAPSDTAEDDSEDADEDDTGPVTTIVILASLGIAAVSGAGFGVVAAARLLNRSVDWVPEIVVRRSLWRLLAVTVAGVVTLFGYVILFA